MTSVTIEVVALMLASTSWNSFQDFSTEAELYHIISVSLTGHLCLHSIYLSEGTPFVIIGFL